MDFEKVDATVADMTVLSVCDSEAALTTQHGGAVTAADRGESARHGMTTNSV